MSSAKATGGGGASDMSPTEPYKWEFMGFADTIRRGAPHPVRRKTRHEAAQSVYAAQESVANSETDRNQTDNLILSIVCSNQSPRAFRFEGIFTRKSGAAILAAPFGGIEPFAVLFVSQTPHRQRLLLVVPVRAHRDRPRIAKTAITRKRSKNRISYPEKQPIRFPEASQLFTSL
jgi:hypothetical protein